MDTLSHSFETTQVTTDTIFDQGNKLTNSTDRTYLIEVWNLCFGEPRAEKPESNAVLQQRYS